MNTNLTAKVKECAYKIGADLVGISPISRFKNAPIMMSPQGILPTAQSVIVCTIHHLDERGFTRTAWPDYINEFTFFNFDINPVHSRYAIGICLVNIDHFYHIIITTYVPPSYLTVLTRLYYVIILPRQNSLRCNNSLQNTRSIYKAIITSIKVK